MVHSRRFLPYIHHFRAIAILFVVASHSRQPLDWSASPLIEQFVEVIFNNGTTLFVFIAGFLFAYLLPKYDTRTYYLNKIKYVILPYILVGGPAVAFFFFRDRILPPTFPADFGQWDLIVQILFLYGTGVMLLPLWFIPMIAIFYVLAPIFAVADRSGRIYQWLPLLFVAALIIPRPAGNLNPFQAFVVFLPIYLLGMWSAKNVDWLMPRLAKFRGALVVSWLVLVFLGVLVFSAKGATYTKSLFELHDDIISISTIQQTVLCFILLYYLENLQTVLGKRLDFLADMSFAIFFLHQYAIGTFSRACHALGMALSGNLLIYVLFTATVIAASIVVVFFVRRIMGPYSRLVVGS